MTVTIFERGRFKVQSRSGEEPYLVDYAAMGGNSKCDCMDFRTNCRKEIERAKAVGEFHPMDPDANMERFKCAHIRAVDRFLARKFQISYKEELRSAGDYDDTEDC